MIDTPPDFVDTTMPVVQRQFLPTPLPLDCQIVLPTADGFTLRCRVNIGVGGKWVPGPKPVAKLPPLPRVKTKKRVTKVQSVRATR